MFVLLIMVEIIVSILLIVAVLMQNSKGGGLAGAFGGGQVGAMFGVRRTADFLSKTTSILAIVFVALCLVINLFVLGGSTEARKSVIQSGTPTSVPAPVAPRTMPPPQKGK